MADLTAYIRCRLCRSLNPLTAASLPGHRALPYLHNMNPITDPVAPIARAWRIMLWAAAAYNLLIGVPGMIDDTTTEHVSFGLVGRSRGWANTAAGRRVDLILTEPVANPVVVVDEVEKAETARSDKGRSFDLAVALAPLYL